MAKRLKKKAIDITPYNHSFVSKIGPHRTFENKICYRDWSDSGEKIVFFLESSDKVEYHPEEIVVVMEYELKELPKTTQIGFDKYMEEDREVILAKAPGRVRDVVISVTVSRTDDLTQCGDCPGKKEGYCQIHMRNIDSASRPEWCYIKMVK